MRYMLLMCAAETEEESPAEASDDPCWARWAEQVQARGVVLHDGARLRPVTAATTVQVRDGAVLLSDGPVAETKEQIAGYDVIACDDLDAAIQAASCHPVAAFGTVEVRPIIDE